MQKSNEIKQLTIALIKAQSEMSNAVKDSTNPFFKNKYADLNSIREACLPLLNKNGLTIIQPTVVSDGKNYIETILLHTTGEFISGLTEIIYSKQNDAQSQGSGITYARRYGMQSLINIGADDDDGNVATQKSAPPIAITKTLVQKLDEAKTILNKSKDVNELSDFFKSLMPDMQLHANIILHATAIKKGFANG